MKLISIITICRNAEKEIVNTLESVINQNINFEQIEMVIVDGKSNDKTCNIIEQYLHKAACKNLTINWKSEPDKGIYDAMNKGVKRAVGEWCLFLNAGDVFFDSFSLGALMKNISQDYEIIYGDSIHRYKNKYKLVKAKPEDRLTYKEGMEFCHQSSVIKRQLLLEQPYSLQYRIAGDCNFFAKAFVKGARFKHINYVLSIFSKDGISSTQATTVKIENLKVLLENNLIDAKNYEIKMKKYLLIHRIRGIIPKKLILIRHDYIMNNAVKNWMTFEEIVTEINNEYLEVDEQNL